MYNAHLPCSGNLMTDEVFLKYVKEFSLEDILSFSQDFSANITAFGKITAIFKRRNDAAT